MRLVLFISALSLSACVTSGDAEVSPLDHADKVMSTPNALAPQTLPPGKCGLFGWNAAGSSDFVFFATRDGALYANGETVQRLQGNDLFPPTDFGPVQLDLGPPETLIDGIRYSQARLSEVLDDGFTRVQPLVILESCVSD